MDRTLLKLECESCPRTTILKVACLTEDDADLLAAESGDVVERKCPTCGEWYQIVTVIPQ